MHVSGRNRLSLSAIGEELGRNRDSIKQDDWQAEEERIKSLIEGLEEGKSDERLLNMQRILELAQQAYFSMLYAGTSGTGSKLLKNVVGLQGFEPRTKGL